MAALTPKQKKVLDFVKHYRVKKGFAPSHEEIKRHLRLHSVATVHEHLATLEQKGYLQRKKNQPRGVEIPRAERMIQIPLLGRIAAGQPIEAIEDRESIAVPQSRLPFPNGNYYALRVQGDSMIDENINDGDIVLVKKQETAENGQKVVALLDNSEATLKTFYKERGQIRLQPANKEYRPIMVKNNRGIAIQGVVTDVIRATENDSADISPAVAPTRAATKKLPLNKIICGDAIEIMRAWPSSSIDMVVTSPPYDSIRDYKGFSLNLSAAGKELYRVLKKGGIAAMVIQDQTKNFGKSLTSFRTILDWCDHIGFKLFETVIYRKYGAEGAWWNKRFRVDHEYIPVFLKGERPQYFDKEHLKIPSKHGGKTMTGGGTRLTNGVRIATRAITINPMKCRGTIWEYMTAGDGSRLKHQHPATFPNQLPYDFIQCFCPKDGIVLDPFVGSGTTTVAAKNLGRQYIGIDIAPQYCELAERRIKKECAPRSDTKSRLFMVDPVDSLDLKAPFFTSHLITYIGNKRRLLPFLYKGFLKIREKLGKKKMLVFDGFVGSGAAARLLKAFASELHVNDLEDYAETLNRTYLANKSEIDANELEKYINWLNKNKLKTRTAAPGFIEKNYAPKNDNNVQPGERAFYTNINAKIVDNLRRLIDKVPERYRHFCLASLLVKASIHTNTSGVFKGFHKHNGNGHFGGRGENALSRIKKEISLDIPEFSDFECPVRVYKQDLNKLVKDKNLPFFDLVYYDPPYNQHPYGSNYFMLNIINGGKPVEIQDGISGIAKEWNRSVYNKRKAAEEAMDQLLADTRARFIVISYNDEGIIPIEIFKKILSGYGKWELMEQDYNTYRGSRNLRDRDIKVKELLWILEKNKS